MSLFSKVCLNNIDLVNRLKLIATDYKTLYVMGCFGAPLTAKNKERYCSNHSYNMTSERIKMINSASEDTFGFDCVNLIKGVLWGWCGDTTKTYGGASYLSNNVPDINADSMIEQCTEISTDFTTLELGEALWIKGHIGVYVGDGLAVECTPKWDNKVQITSCNQTIQGYNRRDWTKHGKLPYIEYIKTQEKFDILDIVKIKEGVTTYSDGKSIPSWVLSSSLYVRDIQDNQVVVSTLIKGEITGSVFSTDLKLVEKFNGEAKQETSVIEEIIPDENSKDTSIPDKEKAVLNQKIMDLVEYIINIIRN